MVDGPKMIIILWKNRHESDKKAVLAKIAYFPGKAPHIVVSSPFGSMKCLSINFNYSGGDCVNAEITLTLPLLLLSCQCLRDFLALVTDPHNPYSEIQQQIYHCCASAFLSVLEGPSAPSIIGFLKEILHRKGARRLS